MFLYRCIFKQSFGEFADIAIGQIEKVNPFDGSESPVFELDIRIGVKFNNLDSSSSKKTKTIFANLANAIVVELKRCQAWYQFNFVAMQSVDVIVYQTQCH